jgi:urease accessory protein
VIRATRVLPAGQWSEAAADTVNLDYDQRHRRRLTMTGRGGVAFLLDLSHAVPLRHGDGLALEDGRIVEVSAAPEALAEVTAASPSELLRVAWHLGNRHLAAELLATSVRIRRDHVIEEMIAGLGATVRHIEAPFDPEAGAYPRGHRHPDANLALDHDDRLEDSRPSHE